MKHKIRIALLIALLALPLCLALSACGKFRTTGTYYLIKNDKYDEETYFKLQVLQANTWTDEDGEMGEYEIDGDKITFFSEILGKNVDILSGTLKDGILTLDAIYGSKVYAQKGAWKGASVGNQGGTQGGSGGGNQGGTQGGCGCDCQDGTQGGCGCDCQGGTQGGQQGNEPVKKNSLAYQLSEDQSYYIVTGIGELSGDIEIPDEWEGKPVKEIASEAFANTNLVTSIKAGANLEKIGEMAFYKCAMLERADLGGKIKTIPQSAFEECAALQEVVIPVSVKSIEQNAFEKCSALSKINYTGTVTDWVSIDFWYSTAD